MKSLYVNPGDVWRFRLVGGTSYGIFNFTIESHDLFVIEKDGFYTELKRVSSIFVGAGQRYSVLVFFNGVAPKAVYNVIVTPSVLPNSEPYGPQQKLKTQMQIIYIAQADQINMHLSLKCY
jgi:FtsP/CotA-like multicopper oxidase with cupredoxin domain